MSNPLDQIRKILDKEEAAELADLKRRVKEYEDEAGRLAAKHMTLIFGSAHDLYDFLRRRI